MSAIERWQDLQCSYCCQTDGFLVQYRFRNRKDFATRIALFCMRCGRPWPTENWRGDITIEPTPAMAETRHEPAHLVPQTKGYQRKQAKS